MAYTDLAQQIVVETTLLTQLMEGLRATLAWKPQSNQVARQLSTLRFISQSFERHLERLMALEEYDGYLDLVLRSSPQLGKAVDALRQDHDFFRQGVRRIVLRLEQAAATDRISVAAVGNKLLVLLNKLDEHNQKERGLMQEAFAREVGGEG